MGLPVPVEYAVAVEQYLDHAAISGASRRVYRISLAGWAWPLVGKPVPRGQERRGAVPPVVPLALLDDPGTGDRLATQLAARTAMADARTANRELLRWLLAGRTWGPVFVTSRRSPRTAVADVCRVTGQARMSYRRAAEIFTALTRPLDTAGRGWTLHQLSAAGRAR
jgi:hypothetical protein